MDENIKQIIQNGYFDKQKFEVIKNLPHKNLLEKFGAILIALAAFFSIYTIIDSPKLTDIDNMNVLINHTHSHNSFFNTFIIYIILIVLTLYIVLYLIAYNRYNKAITIYRNILILQHAIKNLEYKKQKKHHIPHYNLKKRQEIENPAYIEEKIKLCKIYLDRYITDCENFYTFPINRLALLVKNISCKRLLTIYKD